MGHLNETTFTAGDRIASEVTQHLVKIRDGLDIRYRVPIGSETWIDGGLPPGVTSGGAQAPYVASASVPVDCTNVAFTGVSKGAGMTMLVSTDGTVVPPPNSAVTR